ncbi:hypothetical protein PFISCL1PPCAC_8293, partial [Pristionchus fissidentatus]
TTWFPSLSPSLPLSGCRQQSGMAGVSSSPLFLHPPTSPSPSSSLISLLLLLLQPLTMSLSECSIVPTPDSLRPQLASLADNNNNNINKDETKPADPIKDLLQLTNDPYQDSVIFVRSPEEYRIDPQLVAGPLLAALPRCARCPTRQSVLRASRFYHNNNNQSNNTTSTASSWISYLFG